jgi:hypothetical protein
MMEAFSMLQLPISEWLCWYREILASVETYRRQTANLNSKKKKSMLAMLTRDNDKYNMQCVWDVVKSQAIWLGMVKERAIFSKGSLTGEVSRILHLKKTTRFVNVTKVLDTTKQLIVSGDEMLSVIAKEAAMRHPPTPSPLEANWIHRHVGLTLRQSESSMSLARNIASKIRGEDCGIFFLELIHMFQWYT